MYIHVQEQSSPRLESFDITTWGKQNFGLVFNESFDC